MGVFVLFVERVIVLKANKLKIFSTLKLYIFNCFVITIIIVVNVLIRSVTIVHVYVEDGVQTISMVNKYYNYFQVMTVVSLVIVLVCFLGSIVILSYQKNQVSKKYNYLVNQFENIGLSKIEVTNSLLTDYDMGIITAWNNSVDEIEKMHLSRERYFKNMVHDLKTPIQLLKSNIQMYNLEHEPNQYVDSIAIETVNLEKTVMNYLLIEKIAFFEKVNKEYINPIKFFDPFIRRFDKLDLQIEITLIRATYIYSDRKMLTKIVDNLCENAMKYRSSGPLTVVVTDKTITFSNKVDPEKKLGNIFVNERSYSNTGNGLGSEIISTYVGLLEWKVSSKQVDQHFIVTINY